MATAVRSILVAVVALLLGYVVLWAIQHLIAFVWHDSWGGEPPAAVILGFPVIAGVLVAFLRSRGHPGHSPVTGLHIGPVHVNEYLWLLAAVLVSLIGGVALGPEVALLLTGGFVGTELARPLGLAPDRAVMVGSGGAIAALLVGPILNGELNVSAGYTFAATDLAVAVAVAVLTALVLFAVRAGARWLYANGFDEPFWWRIGAVGLVIGLIGVAYQFAVGEPVALVFNSGENAIVLVTAMTSIGLVAVTTSAKAVLYALSLGGGFRGGMYFPAMFIGAGVGTAIALLVGSAEQSAATAGILAAVTYLARTKWAITVVIGAVIGMLVGGVALLPAAILGAVIGRVAPAVTVTEPDKLPSTPQTAQN